MGFRECEWGGWAHVRVFWAWAVLAQLLGAGTLALRTGTMREGDFKFTHKQYDTSIMENSVGKTYIDSVVKMGIYNYDATIDVKYKIIAGDEDKLFRAEERVVGDFVFLRIRTQSAAHSSINREKTDSYRLTVRAKGRYKSRQTRALTAESTVLVNVIDMNDLSPLFHPMAYEAEVPEDMELHQSILQVAASDADVGINGDIYYSFSEKSELFAIHPTSGIVSLIRKLSYIEQNYYDLTILAQDRGPSYGRQKRFSRAQLQVRVLEVNFYSPEIEIQGLPAVVEHGKIGTIYSILYVRDRDYGANGELKAVQIVGGDPHGYFKLDPGDSDGEYTIKVAKTLDRELNQYGFNLTILASDRGNPSRDTTRNVHVQLKDTNDNAPNFHQSVYQAAIEECVPVHTPLLFVNASDPDYGKNAEIQYTIVDGDANGWFTVDRSSGLIGVARPLDAEVSTQLTLKVQAQDQANRGSRRVSETLVHVEVQDCNDNSPVFRDPEPVVDVDESKPAGTVVYQVSAYDEDSDDNGYISYSIANVDNMPFTIDHFTGEISTKEVLDYESMRRLYSLVIRASDWGSPYRRESEMVLKVQVRDANDHKPQFEKVDCAGYLSREAPPGTKLVTVSAIDFDAGNIISYQIRSGNDDGCFEISSSTGVLKTRCIPESEDNHLTLIVTATDGVNYADPTTVNITFVNNNRNHQLANQNANFNCRDTYVTEELGKLLEKEKQNAILSSADVHIPGNFVYSQNKFAPQFLSVPKSVSIREGLPAGEKILAVNADDEDHGYNGRVMFVITSGNQGGTFSMDTYRGDLIVMGRVDRETRKAYDLNVTAVDMGNPQKSSSVILHVSVDDVNDNAPVFNKPSYSASVLESVEVNTTVIRVQAEDMDQGENAHVQYSIITDTEDFWVDAESGVIKVNKALDREKQNVYELQIRASDSGDVPLSSTVTVTVSITDINDNAPKFTMDRYVVRIREDLPVYTIIMTISAEDPDAGAGGSVRYSLTDGTDDKFEIDKATGTVRIIAPLDYEIKQVYNITVRARDRGEPRQQSKCDLVIEVVDVNENAHPPRFMDFVFQGRVKENQPRNTSVFQVIATDDDSQVENASPKDYQILYSIRDGSGLGRFTIDNNGVIHTNEILDRESQTHYWLTVYAQDRGTIPLSSYVEVMVEVEDVNDNVPQTIQPVYYPSIMENMDEGTSVVRLTAFDLDDTKNNQITYSISSGNPQGFFIIDRNTGLIKTSNRHLDREQQEEHILEVTVSDNGVPQLSSTTRIVVTVHDANDQSPEFMDEISRVRIPAMAQGNVDVPLYRIIAHDKDVGANGDIDYSIRDGKGNGRFRIHPKTGMIYSQKDFNDGETYDLTIRAVDNGRPQKKNQARVRFEVVGLSENSEHAPAFTHLGEGITATVMESENLGEMVYLVEAKDEDGDKVWFSITDGNTADETFSIDPENGNILLARKLDWESRNMYNLTIKATDGVRDTYSWLEIKVLDINDNRPQFSQGTYEVTVAENTARGTDILTVVATDADEDKRLFYTIHSSTDNASREKFKINSETGIITTTDALNREAISRHELTIMVRDQGTPSKRSLARVVINVEDHNDNAPEFLGPVFEGRVFETAAIGTSVVQVMAIDRDKGKNAELKYSIISGNIGSTFSMDGMMGIISVAKPLDRATQDHYSLVVKASDGGSPSLTSTVPVNIHVTVSNNAPPKFEYDEYTAELIENEPEGTHVSSVHASSRSSVTYELVSGNQGEYFLINPNSGVISSAVVFDFEETEFFNLTVRATNMVGAYVDTTLLVHLIDENDNSPVFKQELYTGNITENSPGGSVILDSINSPLVIKATDQDTGLNALLTYQIVEQAAQDVFEIDSSTGALRTRQNLDREESGTYLLTVRVSDMGNPQRTAELPAKVVINVLDVNDSPPVFSSDLYTSNLLLPTFAGVVVMAVTATDPDLPENSPLTYRIREGNEHGHFSLDPDTGVLTVARTTEMLDSYEFDIEVTDGAVSVQTVVQISVDYTQNSGLQFSEEEYHAEIIENATETRQVAVVQAVGHALNEHLTFSILNPSDMFVIGETSGVVETTGRPFDRESRDNITVVVEVKDQRDPPRIAHVRLKVHVLDINDNAPIFINQPYYVIVSYDAQRGDIVQSSIKAVDRDVGDNGDVHYRLVDGGEGKFNIRSKTGDIFLSQQLSIDDQNKQMVLHIRAEDRGNPSMSSDVHVPLVIRNEATPTFSEPYVTVTVPEDVPIKSSILFIEATSPRGKKLIYSITNGDIYGEFAVDFNTGSLTVTEKLDYETRQSYELTIRATDIATGSYAEAIVLVKLEDVNDQVPEFQSLMYTATVSEAVSIGTSILTVTADDRDSGLNALVHYRIESQKNPGDSQFFHIDQEKGIILTKQRLDHEVTKVLIFQVVATDSGIPALNTSVSVRVVVTDLNDNPPKFDQPSYDTTITDLATRGQFVTIVTASDADSSDAGRLAYSIVGGNVKQAFSIEEFSGIISLSSLRKPDLQPSYLLNVSVTDGVFTAFTRVRIAVESSNAHVPAFLQAVYDVDVAENTVKGTSIATVSAEDADLGVYGQVVYSIGSEASSEMFRVDARTGVLYTEGELDRESVPIYQIPVVATDGGGRSGYTGVHVNVADRGDHRPQFQMNEYKANVYAHADEGFTVLQVSASDKDIGSNSDLDFGIYETQAADIIASQYFSVDAKRGVISIKRSLGGLENELFQFFMRATDKSSPPLHSEVPVEIYVMGPVDFPPSFEQDEYTYFIPEKRPVGSTIAVVKAESNETLTYSIVAGELGSTNNPAKFGIDEAGRISVIDSLDRETVESFQLHVKAETKTSPPLVAYTKVVVNIMDINDNTPEFESDPYKVSIAENAEVGSKVVQVIAHDADTGANADVSYEFGAGDSQWSDVFALDPQTGWLTTLVELDRETIDAYEFNVMAKDRGAQLQLSDETTVRITVTDHNDEPPVFSQAEYRGAVNEDALAGTIILMVSTTDLDLSQNAKVAYHITGGDPLGQFHVRSTGEIYVNKELDRETKSYYELTISATDGAFVTRVKVYLTILDANDNAPVCEQPMYQQIIIENTPVGSLIVKVTATDADESGTRNARLEYSLSGDSTDTFKMHERDGIISTKHPLDRETTPSYHLKVTAMDGGGLYCTADVYITLSDVNDNQPQFSMAEYTVMIPEDAEVNTLLTRVSAVDMDLGINRKVKFAMKERSKFKIDELSGIVSLTESLDRERKPKYNLTIYAHDQGTPKMTSTAHLIVLLLDINDNPPEFEHSLYEQTVPEDTPVSATIMRVFATSRDTGVNAEISYTIVGGNEQNKFSVDSASGVLTIREELDYEAVKEYMLTVQANDGGTPSLSNTAIVKINLTDANDNVPVFAQAVYTAEVAENARQGTNILQVQAVDRDSPANAAITYKLVGGDDLDQFFIDPKEGFISINNPLDRETIDKYGLEIHAVDSGSLALTGTVMVNLVIQDVNDCEPSFSQSNYTAVLQVDDNGKPSGRKYPHYESSELGCTIIRLEVTDDDLDPNGPPFSFDIIDGNQGHEFKIDRDGVITTAARFDRQIKDVYLLTARVFDNGTPTRFADVIIEVKIVEESAFPPIVTPLSMTVTAVDEAFPGGVIGRVKAYDKDAYDSLEFLVVSDNSNYFSIHLYDGTLTAVQSLDPGEYHINVSVSDGKFATFTDVVLTVEDITANMKENAVIVRFQHLLPEEFIGEHLKTFVNVMKNELAVRASDIKVISVQPATDTVITPSKRKRKRSTDQDLDVMVAVRKSQDKFHRGNGLRRKLLQATEKIENQLGAKVLKIFNDVCTKDSCLEGTCETVIHFDSGTILTIITDKDSHVSAAHTLGFQCNCRPGFGGPYCGQEVDACTLNPCQPPMECEVVGASYKCNCPGGLAGENCDLVTMVDGETPMSFSGHGYTRWQVTVPMERRLSLSLRIKTLQHRARLMHAVGRVDYSILEIESGMVQYRFDCGSGEGMARVDNIQVSDGYWHDVVVERNSRNIKIIIDNKYIAEGTAPGTNDVLNLDSKDLFFGAEVALLASGDDSIRQGYVGCLLGIKIDNMALPRQGGNRVAIYKNEKNVQHYCQQTIKPSVCSSSPCYNGGTCIPLGKDTYTCQCLQPRFVGSRCEVDTDPCASSPCLHGGVCENQGNNEYHCKCHSNLNGKRCELNYFCLNNPCKNRGKCRDGDTGPVCECDKGFSGKICSDDINECESNPCLNGAGCLNLHGGFKCNCTHEATGDLCEQAVFPEITSSTMGINLEEILGIAGVVVGILIIVIIFIVVVRWRRRKRRRRNGMLNTSAESGDLKLKCSDEYKRGHKMNNINSNLMARNHNHHVPSPQNSPRPPPVPTRPASYTPSGADSVNTLNNTNFDTARNYGSAADELEVSGTLREPIEIPDFLQNVDVQKSPGPMQRYLPAPPAEEEPLLPKAWDPNNFAHNYPEDLKKQSKKMPNENQSMQSLPLLQSGSAPVGGSLASLQSENEDEMQANAALGKSKPGYHWDTSDWNPTAGAPLHSIAEVPNTEVRDSGSSHSNDSNVHIDPGEYDCTDYPDEFEDGFDSEYVGDSEYAENEFAGEETDDPDAEYPDRPDFKDILAMQGELDYGDLDHPQRYALHPNDYLPEYNISQNSGPGDWADPGPSEMNGNFDSTDNVVGDEDEGVIHYGFPSNSLRNPKFRGRPISYAESDYQGGGDEMSISMGGYTSTNASMSDMSDVRLCEIEDSEVNLSDDSGDEARPLRVRTTGSKAKGGSDKTHTRV